MENLEAPIQKSMATFATKYIPPILYIHGKFHHDLTLKLELARGSNQESKCASCFPIALAPILGLKVDTKITSLKE